MTRIVRLSGLCLAFLFLLCGCEAGPTPARTQTTPSPAPTEETVSTLAPIVEAPTLAPTLTDTQAPSATETPTASAPTSALPTEGATVASTATLAPPTAEATVGAAATSAPPASTATLPPTAVALPPATRVIFASGATSAVVEGVIPAHGTLRYVLRAAARQVLEANATSAQAVQLAIQGANGAVLKDSSGAPSYRGLLKLTQDYYLALTAGDAAATFSLQVIIPVRMAFALGTTSGAVNGKLPAHSHNYYVLGAQAGQLMDVGLSPDAGLGLSVYGLDGTVLQSGMGDTPAFRGLLPSTQDYVLVVRTADSPATYSLNVMIPERIRFAAGAVGAVRKAKLGAHQQHAYVLGASGGQQMKVQVSAPGEGVRMSIYGVDGEVLMSGMSGGAEFVGTLPSTQDYVVSISTGDAARVYTLEVTITD